MPAVSRQKQPKKRDIQLCLTCGKANKFYKSKNLVYAKFGTVPVCKECLQNMFVEAYRRFQDNELAMIEVCKKTNCCFIKPIFLSAQEQLKKNGIELINAYFKSYNLSKTKKDATFFDSDIFEIEKNTIKFLDGEIFEEEKEIEEEIPRDEWLIDLFGIGFEGTEYDAMERKYHSLMNNYSAPTAMHVEALVTYVKYKCKEEGCIALGIVDEAKKWAALASSAATAAKLNPSQFSQSDLQGGLNTFSDIFKAVEQAKDVVPILPQFKANPNDSIDFLLWSYINYARELEGLPRCTYGDTYKYYDARVAEYIDKTGDPHKIFEQDFSVENRENIYKHISDIENRDGTFVKPIEEGGIDD